MGSIEIEKEPNPNFPYECPDCGADLSLPGALIVWDSLPIQSVGHIEPGEGGVIIALDKVHELSPPDLQCFECGTEIEFPIKDVYCDQDCETEDI